MRGFKLAVWLGLGIAFGVSASYIVTHNQAGKDEAAYRQLQDDDAVVEADKDAHWRRNAYYVAGGASWVLLGVMLFWGDCVTYNYRIRGKS
jgi:cell division protein FtsX